MENKKIEERRKRVLAIVVRLYVDSAEPISSKVVSDRVGLSSATVRNIMSDLERLGYIFHPHTSAGRIPTEKGYRFYVNFLMEPGDIPLRERSLIDSINKLTTRRLEDIVEESSYILSYISSLAAITMFPRAEENKLYFDGTHHILEQPEFKDSDIMLDLFRALEEEEIFLDIFRSDLDTVGTEVHIGRENGLSILDACSIITANYSIQGNVAGTIGVIGPTRMNYRKLVPAVDYLAQTMSSFFNKIT